MTVVSTDISIAKLLAEHGMELELLHGVSGIVVGYRISKTFHNRNEARVWVSRVVKIKIGKGGGDEVKCP